MSTFETFNFDSDPRWKEYKTNTDVPHVSDAEGVEYRLKLRFYKKFIDANYDPYKKQEAPSANSSSSTSSNPSNQSARRQSAPPTSNTQSVRSGMNIMQYVWLFSHVSVLVNAFFYLVPLVGTSEGNYSRAFFSATIANAISLFNAVGVPRFNRETLQRIMMNDSTQYVMLYLLMSTYSPFIIALIPPVVYSFYHICNSVNANTGIIHPSIAGIYRKILEPKVRLVLSQEQNSLMWVTQVEVMTMFAIIFNTIIGYGSIFLCLVYYWFLTHRYMLNYQTRMICDALGVKLDQFFYGPSCPAIISKFYGYIRNYLRNSVQQRMQQQ